MTAMCDVAFLLLSFFIMTSTARLPEPFPVDTPRSTVLTKLPDTNLATITVGGEQVFFGVVGQEVRRIMLDKMSELYKVQFTPKQRDRFALIDFFGVDIKNLGKIIDMSGTERNEPGVQGGIPFDSTSNQLRDWIYNARQAQKQFVQEAGLPREAADLNIAIKGDRETDFPVIKKVIDILQEQGKNNFFLVTGLRGDDF